MIGTTVTVPRDKLTAWHWINKEHPFQLVSHDQYKRTYTGVCGSTDYVFRCLGCTDKEIVLQLKEIVTPARKATPALSALRTGTVSEQLVRENARLVSENEKLTRENKSLGYHLEVSAVALSVARELNAQDRSRIALLEKSLATVELELRKKAHPVERQVIALKKPPVVGDVLRAHEGDTGSTVMSCGSYVQSRGNGTGYTYTWKYQESAGVHVLFGVGVYDPS